MKPGKVGGLTSAMAIHDVAAEAGIGLRLGGMIETDMGRAHSLALATLPGFELPTDLGPAERSFTDAEVASATPLQNGQLHPTTDPGLGIDIDRAEIENLAVDVIA